MSENNLETESNLTVVSEPTLDELFDKKALELTKPERHRILEALRKAQALWMTEENDARVKGKKAPNPNKGVKSIRDLAVKVGDLDIDISDLDLEI